MLEEASDGKLKMQVIAAGGEMPAELWSVHILQNHGEQARSNCFNT